MRHTEVTTDGTLRFAVSYPNSVAFLYSPQIIRIDSLSGDLSGLEVTVQVLTPKPVPQTHAESRKFHDGSVTFDISRAMQLLAPDVDTLLHRLHETEGASLCQLFGLFVYYRDSAGSRWDILRSERVIAMYGALDQGEVYGEHSQRRLYVNFPQTFNLWENESGEVSFLHDGIHVYPNIQGGPCHECDLVSTLTNNGQLPEFGRALYGPQPLDFSLTWQTRIEQGTEHPEGLRTLTLIPDCSLPGDGTYLRWLNRRGEVSYRLFKNSQIRTSTSASNSFSRYYDNDPSEPMAGAYINTQKTDFTETREMIIGAVGLSYDEYQDVCDLATSPIVERLLSDNTTGRLESGQYVWQRVNVVAGTFERNIRRNTPSLQDLEIIIRLPERNTIKL